MAASEMAFKIRKPVASGISDIIDAMRKTHSAMWWGPRCVHVQAKRYNLRKKFQGLLANYNE